MTTLKNYFLLRLRATLLAILSITTLLLSACSSNTPFGSSFSTRMDVEFFLERLIEKMNQLSQTQEPKNILPFRSNYDSQDQERYGKDDILAYPVNNGIDLEWLLMSLEVLNFSKSILDTSYVLGETTLVSTLDIDRSLWGWGLGDFAEIILTFDDEVLYLRVIDEGLTQTFFHTFNQEDKIQILRLYEQGSIELEVSTKGCQQCLANLYVEHFSEEEGLSMWWDNGQLLSWSTAITGSYELTTIITEKDSTPYSFRVQDSEVDIFGYYEPNTASFSLFYDLKESSLFDSFNLTNLFLNDEIVLENLEIEIQKANFLQDKFWIYYRNVLNEAQNFIRVPELVMNIQETYHDIITFFESTTFHSKESYFGIDFTLERANIIEVLSSLLYYPPQ